MFFGENFMLSNNDNNLFSFYGEYLLLKDFT